MKNKKHKFVKDRRNKNLSQCSVCGLFKIIRDGQSVYRRPDGLTDNTNTAKNCFVFSDN